MIEVTRRSFLSLVGAAAFATTGGVLFSGCSGSAPSAVSSAASSVSSTASSASSAATEAFMSQGKGKHLAVGRRGKLFKIAPSVIAENLGYFAEEGCDVEFQTVELAEGFASLASDNLDVMLMGIVQTCEYIAKGSPLYIFGGTVLNGTEIIVPNSFEGELTTPDDFRGKNIGFQRSETGQIAFRAWLIENGLDINGKDVTFTPLDNEQAMIEAVVKGEVDIVLVNNAFGYIDRDRGIKVAGAVKDLTGDYPCCRQNASNAAYHDKYLSLVDFEIAILRGYKVFKEDPEQVIPMMVEYSGQSEEVVRAGLYGTSDYTAVMDLSPDPCRNAVIKFYEDIKIVESTDPATAPSINVENMPTIEDYVVANIYKDALDTLMQREPSEQFWKDMYQQYKQNNE